MNLREAATLALEALENHTAIKHPQQIHYRDSAIEALRTALAEPNKCTHGVTDGNCKECYMADEQEPVAWMDREGDLYKMPEIKNWAPPHTMLYTAPPQRKPLSDEHPLMVFAKECVLGAYSEKELADAANRAIKYAHSFKGEA